MFAGIENIVFFCVGHTLYNGHIGPSLPRAAFSPSTFPCYAPPPTPHPTSDRCKISDGIHCIPAQNPRRELGIVMGFFCDPFYIPKNCIYKLKIVICNRYRIPLLKNCSGFEIYGNPSAPQTPANPP